MSAEAYTFVGHAQLEHANPLGGAAVGRAVAHLPLVRADRFVDIGAGKAVLCILLAMRGLECDAVERSSLMAADARRRIAALPDRAAAARVTVVEQDAVEFIGRVRDGRYAGAACIGSTHALGGLVPTLDALRRIVRPAGWALIGEGFWERPPCAEYLNATGIEPGEFTSLARLADTARAHGWDAHQTLTAAPEDWDAYEAAHARAIEAHASAGPGDPGAAAMLARSRAWREAYRRWGRGTLGFALLVCRARPLSPGGG